MGVEGSVPQSYITSELTSMLNSALFSLSPDPLPREDFLPCFLFLLSTFPRERSRPRVHSSETSAGSLLGE